MSLEALKRDGWPEFIRNDNPICPHCGCNCDISDNELWHLLEEGDHDIECPSCGKEFHVVTNVAYSFSTDEQEEIEEQGSDDNTEKTEASE